MFIRLLKAQLKQAAKNAPYLLGAFALLGLICGGFAFSAAKYLYSEKDGKITIALYYPEDEASSLMIAAIEKMDSAKQNLEIKRVEKEEVLPMVKRGEAYCGIIMPEDFVKDIITGKNTPAAVYLPKNSTADSLLARSYLSAGIGDLAAAQAGIYALLDCFGYGSDKTDLVNINLVYLNAAFSREEAFKAQVVSASGSLSTLQYYTIGGFIIFLLLIGSLFSRLSLSAEGAVASRLKIFGISGFKLWLSSFIVTLLIYIIISAVIVSGLFMLPAGLGLKPDVGLYPLIGLSSLILFCALFISAAFCLFDFAAPLIIFMFTLICALLSGAILPASFLPQKIQILTPYMPIRILADALSSAYDPSAASVGIAVPIITLALIWIIFFIKDRLN